MGNPGLDILPGYELQQLRTSPRPEFVVDRKTKGLVVEGVAEQRVNFVPGIGRLEGVKSLEER